MFGWDSGEGEVVGKMSGTDPALAGVLLVLVGAPAADAALPSMQVLCLMRETWLLEMMPLLHPTNRRRSAGIF